MNLNLALSDTTTISSADGEIDVSLDPANHGATFDYLKRIREQLIARYPNYTFSACRLTSSAKFLTRVFPRRLTFTWWAMIRRIIRSLKNCVRESRRFRERWT